MLKEIRLEKIDDNSMKPIILCPASLAHKYPSDAPELSDFIILVAEDRNFDKALKLLEMQNVVETRDKNA